MQYLGVDKSREALHPRNKSNTSRITKAELQLGLSAAHNCPVRAGQLGMFLVQIAYALCIGRQPLSIAIGLIMGQEGVFQ